MQKLLKPLSKYWRIRNTFYLFLFCTLSATDIVASEIVDYQIEILAEGLDRPYSIAFLPDGDLLVTEKSGKLRVISNGILQLDPVAGVPPVYIGHQGGLLDVVLHPRFSENHWLYLSLTQGTEHDSALSIYRATYVKGRLSEVVQLYTAVPRQITPVGFGGRMAFLPDETLLLSIGEGYEYREEAQNLGSSLGKIVRITDDGNFPPDNPFFGKKNARPEIWSYGHRVPIGILYDSFTNTLYAHENGPMGGDELNIINPGNNYGWPIATYGLAYSGAYVSPFTHYPGTEQPLIQWTPSLAPSGLTLCHRCQWRAWEGDLFVGMLAGQHVRRLHLQNGVVVEQQVLFKELGERIRDARFGPDGALYLLTDNTEGGVLKVSARNN